MFFTLHIPWLFLTVTCVDQNRYEFDMIRWLQIKMELFTQFPHGEHLQEKGGQNCACFNGKALIWVLFNTAYI